MNKGPAFDLLDFIGERSEIRLIDKNQDFIVVPFSIARPSDEIICILSPI